MTGAGRRAGVGVATRPSARRRSETAVRARRPGLALVVLLPLILGHGPSYGALPGRARPAYGVDRRPGSFATAAGPAASSSQTKSGRWPPSAGGALAPAPAIDASTAASSPARPSARGGQLGRGRVVAGSEDDAPHSDGLGFRPEPSRPVAAHASRLMFSRCFGECCPT
jgi:hypothetical protein